MSALGLHRLVPRSLLAGRWLVVLVCYLDDSGKDPQNPVTTLAGYVAKEDMWRDFEVAVEPVFADKDIKILHAKDLHDTDGEFKGWRVLEKQAFVARICQTMSPRLPLGVSMSAHKANFAMRAAQSGRKRTVTSYTLCFNWILDHLLRSILLGRIAHTEGLAFILECGNEHNKEVEQQFYEVRALHKLEGALRSISFVPKDSCRAIQIADLLAFFSRRDARAIIQKGRSHKPEPMMNLIAGSVPLLSYVSTDVEYRKRPGVQKGRLS